MDTDNPSASVEMCIYCFDVLHAHFKGQREPDFPFPKGVNCPMFITLNTIDRRGKSLRGCIGTLSARPLEDMSYFVMSSAFRDSRFSPLQEQEMSHLEVCVSLLVKYESASNYLDWEVGVHGIIIEFENDRKRYSATYLPEVASEQGWNQEQAIESLVRKAGYKGRVTPTLLQSISLTRYQSSKERLSHTEYLQLQGAVSSS
mmetsp:Transcript_23014/g.33670  ORF Transcript_23014/g.33670 Transcript_23014/m.33670 type:complete len:202 (-) Transcript_23014:236-841(-)